MLVPMNCSVLGTTIPNISLAGEMLAITKTDDSHIVADMGSMCSVHFTVNGTTATADSGQTCNITYMVLTLTLDVSSWILTASGGTLTSTESGSAPIGGANCTITGNSTLMKDPDGGTTGSAGSGGGVGSGGGSGAGGGAGAVGPGCGPAGAGNTTGTGGALDCGTAPADAGCTMTTFICNGQPHCGPC
jgi:hypothetical protein